MQRFGGHHGAVRNGRGAIRPYIEKLTKTVLSKSPQMVSGSCATFDDEFRALLKVMPE